MNEGEREGKWAGWKEGGLEKGKRREAGHESTNLYLKV